MSWLDAWRHRTSALLFGRARNRELEEEIAHHLALETQRQIEAGLDPVTARARALERFGNPRDVTDATREARGEPLMEGGMQDFRWAVRSLRKHAGFTTLALVTIALGIGTTTAAFTVMDTVLLRPLPYRNADRLMLMRERTKTQTVIPPSFPNFADWRTRARPFDAVASAQFPFAITVWPRPDAEPVRAQIMGVSRGFFSTLGVSLAAGREFTEAENSVGGQRVVMVTYEFWREHLGGRQPLGTMRWSDTPVEIVGVTPPDFRFTTSADVFFPHEQWPGTMRSSHNYLVVGRLRPGTTIESARTEMTALAKVMHAEFGDETMAVDVDVQPLRDYMVGNFRLLLSIVFGAAALVLLIACVNLLCAQLARGWSREHEIVVRSALGASRGRLVRQLCLETGLLVAVGGTLGAILAFALVGAIRRFGAGLLPRLVELQVDARSLLFAAGATVVTTSLVGLYPALRSARVGAASALRSGHANRQTVRATLWRALIGFEVALAVVLVVGSGLLIRTLHNILNADTGLDVRGVVTASFSPEESDLARLQEIANELGSVPGVQAVAFTNRLPFTWGNGSGPLRRPGDPLGRDWPAMAGFRVVSPDYFSVVRQQVVAGRAFTASDDANGAGVAIITTGVAEKLWPGLNPIGKTIATNYLMKEWLTVVGVVSEASNWSMPRGSQHEIYVPLAQHPKSIEGQLIAVVRTRIAPASVSPTIRERMRRLAPRSPAQIGTLEERIERTAADRRFGMLALSAFGIVGLALAGIGIYGVMWYIVTTRTREIGIRMALGATAGLVRRHMLRAALAMAGVGIAAGGIASLFATKYLAASLYGVSRVDPVTFAVGGLIVMLSAIAGAYVPARRSSRVDPMSAIRIE